MPPELGFGDQGTVLRPTEHVPTKQGVVPPGATLEYELTLLSGCPFHLADTTDMWSWLCHGSCHNGDARGSTDMAH